MTENACFLFDLCSISSVLSLVSETRCVYVCVCVILTLNKCAKDIHSVFVPPSQQKQFTVIHVVKLTRNLSIERPSEIQLQRQNQVFDGRVLPCTVIIRQLGG